MRMHLRASCVAVTAMWLTCTTVLAQTDSTKTGPTPPPPARQVPGLNAADAFPRGCVDCHINMKEWNKDERFSTRMTKWNEKVDAKLLEHARADAADPTKITGRHPKATASLANIPAACLTYHKKDSKTGPPFARLVHAIHLTGGEQNPFMTYFQGECTHCHKLDAKTGQWSMPSAAEE